MRNGGPEAKPPVRAEGAAHAHVVTVLQQLGAADMGEAHAAQQVRGYEALRVRSRAGGGIHEAEGESMIY